MLWGPEDPIFSDRYLDDLADRLPHADIHRFEGAGHLLAEDRPYADAVLAWLGDNLDRLTGAPERTPEGPRLAPRRPTSRDMRPSRPSGIVSTSVETTKPSRSPT